MKKIFTFFLALVASVSAIYASDIKVGGICYDFDNLSKTATVTYLGDSYDSYSNEYYGSVVIPSSVTYKDTTYSVTSIGEDAFKGCSKLTSVTIPNSVTSIGSYAFYDCSSLTSVTIGESVTSIGSYAFYECSSLTSVTIPNSVTSIGASAFRRCSSLTSVTIPNSVTSIGTWAFCDCSSLASITIPNSVMVIGDEAFYDCSSLTSVTIGESVTSIGYGAFRDCSSLTKTNYTGDIAGWCNIKFGSDSANPMYYSHNFYINDQKIKNLVIPESVTSIGVYAFYECSSLTSVTIGESVTCIGDYAFAYCSSLTSVTIPESVTSIGNYAFSGCSSLTSVTIGESVTSIGNYAFYECSSLTSVTIGESVTSIGDYAFYHCSSLTSITIPNSVTNIGESAFRRCSSLTSVTIPNSVTSIGLAAFSVCSSLTSVTIGESVTSIGDFAFHECSSLTKTNYTGDIAGWCNIGFSGGTANPIYYSHNFYINDQEIKDLVIPNNVTSIGAYAFQKCSSLTSVTFGESVTSIGNYAFNECSSLTSITCEARTPPTLGLYAFDGVSKSIPVYIPCESIQSYREHNEWGRFQNLQCVKPEDPKPEDPQDSEMCLNSADERAVFFQGEEFGTSANVYMWDPANDNNELVGSWPGSAATHLGDGNFKFVIPTSVSGDPSTWMIIWNNGIGGTQTKDLTFTMHGLYNMSGVQSVITTLCDGSNTDDPNEEVITCAEAVSICQQTGTTATTKEYTIRGYVTKIEAAYSEQYDNITFWMADTSPMQMDNSSNSVTSISDYSNIALGKSTTASSSQNSGTLPEYINDGDFSTRWSSEWQDNEYITIDLEQYSFIDHITLHWEFAYASQFAILITDEQPSSSALSSPLPSSATCYQSSGDVQTIPVAKSGRYITLIGIERATAYGISLYELEAYGAYGMPLLQAYCVKPIQSTDKYVQIGDYVEAVGTLVNYGGTTPEINAGGTYTILTTTTAVENTHIQSSMTNCQKIIRNGQLIILRDGKTYNVMGLEL